MLTDKIAPVQLPAFLASKAVQAVFGSGAKPFAAAACSTEVAILTAKVLKAMWWTKLKMLTASLFVMAAVGATTSIWALRAGEGDGVGSAKIRGGLAAMRFGDGKQQVDEAGGQQPVPKEQERLVPEAQVAEKPKTDAEKIQGRWKFVSAKREGVEVPFVRKALFDNIALPEPPVIFPKGRVQKPVTEYSAGYSPSAIYDASKPEPEFINLKETGAIITDGIIIFTAEDGPRFIVHYGFKLYPNEKVDWIDVSRAGSQTTIKGLYRVEGDKLQIVLGSGPKEPRPAKFTSEPDSPNFELWEFKREPPPKQNSVAKQIQGTWTIGLGGLRTQDLGEGWVTVTDNKISIKLKEVQNWKGQIDFVYLLDSGHKPGKIDLYQIDQSGSAFTGPDLETLRGSFILDGNSLSLVLALQDWDRATDFVAQTNNMLLVLKRGVADYQQLLGEWSLFGESIPTTKMKVTPQKILLTSGGKILLEATYQLDPFKQPPWIDLTDIKDQKRKMKGLYLLRDSDNPVLGTHVQGGQLQMVYDESGLMGRPNAFARQPGTANGVYWDFGRSELNGPVVTPTVGKDRKSSTEIPNPTIPPPSAEKTAPTAMVKALADTDESARAKAIEELHQLSARVTRVAGTRNKAASQHPAKVQGLAPHLIKAALDPAEANRIAVLYALADTLDAEAVARIRDRLNDPSEKVRFTAACLLAESQDAAGLGELKKALGRLRTNLTGDNLSDATLLLSAMEEITGRDFGEIPIPADAARPRIQQLLDTWAAWWTWSPK
jgi:uncharacterized protein (TIGR03067 family)